MSALWLALRVDQLPLKLAQRGRQANATRGLIVVSAAARARVIALDPIAARAGIGIGMSTQAARALTAELDVAVYQAHGAQSLMQTLAQTLYAFSPQQFQLSSNEMVLEIQSSTALFGGLKPLLTAIEHAIDGLDLKVRSATHAHAFAAMVLARSGVAQLDDVDVASLGLPPDIEQSLFTVGITQLRDLLRLPRAELARRFSPALVSTLDLLHGGIAPAWRAFEPSEKISVALDLVQPAHTVEQLRFAIKRGCDDIAEILSARQLGALALKLQLHHERRAQSDFQLNFSAANGDRTALNDALLLRLNQSVLRDEVLRLVLTVPLTAPLAPRTGDLFAREDPEHNALGPALDRLRARLGDAAIVRPTLSADHRLRVSHPQAGTAPDAPRPLLLSTKPERIARPQLELINGPERIESGWWDGADQARDYWVARRQDGALVLVFEDLRARDNWWLEGFFE